MQDVISAHLGVQGEAFIARHRQARGAGALGGAGDELDVLWGRAAQFGPGEKHVDFSPITFTFSRHLRPKNC